jgi:amino acid transporter
MDGVEPTAAKQIGIHAGLLISHGVVNSFGIKTLAIFNRISITLHSVGVASLAIALLASAPRLRTGKEVFATFLDGTGIDAPGWSERASPAYVAVCGILLAQFTITGFDASAHMSEGGLRRQAFLLEALFLSPLADFAVHVTSAVQRLTMPLERLQSA